MRLIVKSSIAVIASIGLLLGSCTATEENGATSNGEATVTDEGISLETSSFRISAPPGVAPEGTSVTVREVEDDIPGEWSKFTTRQGPAAEILLEGGTVQPEQPITVEFLNVEPSETTFILHEEGDGAVPLETTRGDGVVVQASHLSKFWAAAANVGDFSGWVLDQMTYFTGMNSPRPNCFRADGAYPEFEATISPVRGDAVWPCLKNGPSGIDLEITGNNALAWTVSATPSWNFSGTPDSSSIEEVALVDGWRHFSPRSASEDLLSPTGTTILNRSDITNSTITLTMHPGMTETWVAISILTSLVNFPDQGKYDAVNCLLGQTTGILDGYDTGNFSSVLRSGVDCISSVGGPKLGIISLLLSSPGFLWANIEGLLRTVIPGLDSVSFDVRTTSAPQTPPEDRGSTNGAAHGGLDVGPAGDGSGAVSPNGKTIESCVIGGYTYSGGAVYTDGTSATQDPVCDRLRDEFYAANPWVCPGGQGATDDPSKCPGGEARSAYDPDLWGGGTGMPNPL